MHSSRASLRVYCTYILRRNYYTESYSDDDDKLFANIYTAVRDICEAVQYICELRSRLYTR